MSEIKLAIALPCHEGHVDVRFMDSFAIMEKPFDWVYMRPTFPQNFPASLDDARNSLVMQAFEAECTHILMMDTDQQYPQDTIARLMSHNKPIVRARVHRRYPPFDPILLRRHENGLCVHIPDEEWMKGGLVEVDATGVCACGLFDMQVFENIPYPWFETVRKDLNDKEHTIIGEDVRFCEKAQEAGYQIFVDCDLEVSHLATFGITQKFYNLYKAARGAETRTV
ncbi:MAG TPA: hypothetical protein PKV86_07085 [Syntrophobacteraceae bacterium]|nr:hypothetical protein [Syntrophobacteraceae bacterium]